MVFRNYKSPDGYPTGQWASVQRTRRKTISAERRVTLDALGFVWELLEVKWEEGFEHLQSFVKDNGDCSVPLKYKASDGFNLGFWVSNQRTKQKILSAERKARLDALGFIWDVLSSQWEEGFEHLKAFASTNGHCRVPGKHKSSDGYGLGAWVNTQRGQIESISGERKVKLDGIGFIWDGFTIIWEEGFEQLKEFTKQNGHCRVPSTYRSSSGYALGQWVVVQRSTQKTLSVERELRLDALGFVWDARQTQWEEGFERLKEFKKQRGHCRVPSTYRSPEGYPLGQWVTVQRTKQKTLSTERKARLDALGLYGMCFHRNGKRDSSI